ncbi:uncharacterized protein DFL_008662 [Arthrobotrys flagrans]|uniref:CRAL-TRIO domain-containing protein n=1 Tax=Arthrobotrys flagrans TaxID=97331 RepID=A0A436ZPF4_ARTFL|nr:hypothetical protein DFL_008662 [Arthrobotrys flagrans]
MMNPPEAGMQIAQPAIDPVSIRAPPVDIIYDITGSIQMPPPRTAVVRRKSAAANCCAINPRPLGIRNIPTASKSRRGSYKPSQSRLAHPHPKPVSAAGSHPIRRDSGCLCLVPESLRTGTSSFCATTSPATPNSQRHPCASFSRADISISPALIHPHPYRRESSYTCAYNIPRSCNFRQQQQLRAFHTQPKTRPGILTRPPRARSHYPAEPTSTSSSNNNTAITATSTCLALIGIYSVATTDTPPSNVDPTTLRSLLDRSDNTPHPQPPPAAMASTAPGRPETLTPEQEVKLKEFWNVTLSLFGQSASQLEGAAASTTSLADDAAALTLDSTATPEEAETEPAAGGSKTKSKRSKIFSRSKKDKEKKDKDKDSKKEDSSVNSSRSNLTVPETTLSNRPSPPPGLTTDPEDKYNQGKDFKAALASQTPEELRTTFWGFVKYDNPDALLLRFLRARKWDVEKALVMMVSTMHWRGQEVHVEDIAREGEATAFAAEKTDKTAEGFMKQLRMGKSYIHGTDREERPVCYVNVRLHKAADQTPESLERYTIYLIETTRLMLKQPVDTAAIVFDMTGFGMANMDYTPVKFMIKCFEAHYPECLGICLVHNAPWIFQGIWKIIRGWLDPVVASKVHFTTKTTDLTEFISLSQLPKSLGGDEDWEYEYIEPTPTENPSISSPAPADITEKETLEAERLRIIEEYEKNTREWIKEESKGAKVDTDVKDERSGLRERLRTNYWGLDRFLRARTWYDRIGMVGKNGEVDFYPRKDRAEETKVNGNGASAAASAPAPTSDDELD